MHQVTIPSVNSRAWVSTFPRHGACCRICSAASLRGQMPVGATDAGAIRIGWIPARVRDTVCILRDCSDASQYAVFAVAAMRLNAANPQYLRGALPVRPVQTGKFCC